MARKKQENKVEKEIMINELSSLFKELLTKQIDQVYLGADAATNTPFRFNNEIKLEKTDKGIQATMKAKTVLEPQTTVLTRVFDVKQMTLGETR